MKNVFLVAGYLLSCSQSHAQDTVRAEANLSTATVYFGYGAELTHQSKFQVQPDTRIIVINNLSSAVDPNSIQISCPEDVALLSHRYQLHYPNTTPVKNPETKRLEDSIILLQKDIARVENLIGIEQEILNKTGQLIETTINTSGNKTITSAEVLKLVEFYNQKIEKAKTNIFFHKQVLAMHYSNIENFRKRINGQQPLNILPQKATGQLILQVVCKKAGEVPVSLSYYTNNAGWTPLYDIRVNSRTNKVKLVYKASLTQTSGINWKKAKLTLSTGTPNFGVAAPTLSPWYLQLYVPELARALQGRVAGLNVQRNTIQSMNNDKVLSEVMVATPEGAYRQQKEDNVDPSTLQQYTTLTEGQLNTNFEIDLPYDIESDGQLHSVTIKDEEITCTLKNYAVPRIDRDAYLLAEVADWQNLDLLPGEANIIMDDTYIGKSIIDPVTTADTLNLSLGKDKRLVVKKSVIKELSSLKTTGSTSKQVFTYELIAKNNKLTDVNLLLKDQFPLSTIKEVEVKLDDSPDAMVNPETGVITWKLELKPGESKKMIFTYSVKFPKDKKIINLK